MGSEQASRLALSALGRSWWLAAPTPPRVRRGGLRRLGSGVYRGAVAKPQMLAAGIVESGGGDPGVVVAFVAVAAGARGSRMFKVTGPANGPTVVELAGATTIDLGQMQQEVQRELEPALQAIADVGGQRAVTRPSADWVCDAVRQHLKAFEGLELD